jgi:hypothetical protein
VKVWQIAVAAALVSAPSMAAGAQSATPPQSATPKTPSPNTAVRDTAPRPRRTQAAQAAPTPTPVVIPIDTAENRPAPNAGGGVGFRSGAITPGVGMTGGNAGGNNSNGRTATPAQGSQGSPLP